ncbi:MAG: DUF1592 domain-containing protein [Pirellulaceae bacterium]
MKSRRLSQHRRQLFRSGAWLGVLLGLAVSTRADDVEELRLRAVHADVVAPFLRSYCLDCHGPDRQEAKLDLRTLLPTYGSDAESQTQRLWQTVIERLEAGDMPPEDARRQPTKVLREQVVRWMQARRQHETARSAGDPGVILPRRLSNAEYDNTIRDLTGVDIRPTREFPVDPANEAGFDNSSESLSMSPALVQKYLAAARQVAEHLVLLPKGIAFAPHPVATDTDRDKYCVKRIVAFYERQRTDVADYFLAAWRYRVQPSNADAGAPLDDIAAAEGLSVPYLRRIWRALEETPEDLGPLVKLQAMWRGLPARATDLAEARQGCAQMREFVVTVRRAWEPVIEDLDLEGSHKGSQPFVLWKNHEYAAQRMHYDPRARRLAADLPPEYFFPESAVELVRHAARDRFCGIFPDSFFVSERGRDYLGKPKDQQEKGRLLSAGFHSMMGYYRDDAPLYELMLDDRQRHELDELWQQLDFITAAPLRQYTGFVWFERTDSRYLRDPEFDFARAEDKDVTSAEKISRLAAVYLAKARGLGGGEVVMAAIERYFRDIDAQIRWVEAARRAAEPSHREALVDFAQRAYRRNLTDVERQDLLAYYNTLRRADGLGHEEAMQDCLVSVLMSPQFCYRLDLAEAVGPTRALTDEELACRLSYFLWASMPDAELRGLAAAGQLSRPNVLRAQVQRMVRDERVRGLALEFGGNWLDFRRFPSHNSVDRERFPEFTDELRDAMFEEPVRFLVELAQQDASVLDLLFAKYTWVNPVLARHYGMPHMAGAGQGWTRVEDADRYERGGLLPMSVFLTANSPGLRTSPVKRGYWVVRRVLGERIPAPPPNVPELPADERQLGDLTLREVMARHREHPNCAGCHERFDSLGLAYETFGPIGELRTLDLGGRRVDARASFPGGDTGVGIVGLKDYLRERRQSEFVANLCRKMLSYALGRTLNLSDDPLVDDMQARLAADGYRFSTLIDSVVTSRQFLYKRGAESATDNSDRGTRP